LYSIDCSQDFALQIFYSSKNDPLKIIWIKKQNKNIQKSLWLEFKILNLKKTNSCENHNYSIYNWFRRKISNFWLLMKSLKNIDSCTAWFNEMDMIYESYFTTNVWESSLNYYSQCHFTILEISTTLVFTEWIKMSTYTLVKEILLFKFYFGFC